MIDLVHTFHKGVIEVDPEENAKLKFPHRLIYIACPNCGKLAEQDLLAHGPGVAVLEYACGCVSHSETGKETKWTSRAEK